MSDVLPQQANPYKTTYKTLLLGPLTVNTYALNKDELIFCTLVDMVAFSLVES